MKRARERQKIKTDVQKSCRKLRNKIHLSETKLHVTWALPQQHTVLPAICAVVRAQRSTGGRIVAKITGKLTSSWKRFFDLILSPLTRFLGGS